jgi:glycosyltransferase involved in cell wall biosynthesis
MRRESAYPVVSILIPAHNAERWVAQSIQSALDQDWPRTEIILVDDGSRDGTLAVARHFESKQVKVITQENQGAAAARNTALSLAQGDYVQWLDADDLLAPDKISKQLAKDEAQDPRVLLSSAFGLFFFRPEKAVFSPTLLWQDLSPVDWITTKFTNNLWMNPAVWLVSRALTEVAGPWNETLSLDDDGEYFCRVLAASSSIKFVPGAKIFYRQWSVSSLSRNSSEKACRSLLTSLKLSIGYLLSLEDSQRTRNAALTYLQIWMNYFYPERENLLEELDTLAAELGGQLQPPMLPRKYELIRHTLGWAGAKKTKRAVAATKLWVRRNWDQTLFKLLDGRW